MNNDDMAESNPQILIVDDDAGQRSLLESCVQQMGIGYRSAEDGSQALAIMRKDHSIGMVLSDIHMPELSGMELLKAMRKENILAPMLLITGFADVRQAVLAMAMGAVNYLEKPIDLDELRQHITSVFGRVSFISQQELLPGTVVESESMKMVFEEISLVAPSVARVMITGESGTGKEVVAEHMHQWSPRKTQPLIKLNCAAIPENLLESELFGHEKGAFTGAIQKHIGCFERANGGTLFLDEVGEMAPELQAKMLRVLQDGLVTRIGGRETIKVDVRVISATNQNLEESMGNGSFREDLYYRLNVVEIMLAPLKERLDDIAPLASLFAKKFAQRSVRFSPGFEKVILKYSWPGNVRELQNAMERAVLLSRGGVLMPEHLPKRILDGAMIQRVSVESLQENSKSSEDQVQGIDSTSPSGQMGMLASVEQDIILSKLKAFNGNRSEAARALGISRRTLLYRIKSMEEKGIVVPARAIRE